jgi:hypothetical protein
MALSVKAAPVTISVPPAPALRMLLLAVTSSSAEIGRAQSPSGQEHSGRSPSRPRTAFSATAALCGAAFSPKPR